MVRGIRNNNPLNIERGDKWQGLRDVQEDPRFCQFVSMEFGCRAALKILRSYIKGYEYTGRTSRIKFDTIEKIVSRWAPSSENNTERYIQFVSQKTGINRFQRIAISDKKSIVNIAYAMSLFECGVDVGIDTFESAWSLI